MKYLLKTEVYRLKNNPVTWGIIAALMLLSVVFMEYPFRNKGIFTANSFQILLAGNTAISWTSVITSVYVFGLDFYSRTYNNTIFKGFSRWNILCSKLVVYYGLSTLLSLIPIIIVSFNLNPSGLNEYPLPYLIRVLFLRLILDLAAVSIPVIILFSLKDIFRSIVVIGLYTYFQDRLIQAEFSSRLLTGVISLNPLKYQKNEILWERSALWVSRDSFVAIGLFMLFVFISTGIAYLLFRKAALE